MNFALYQVIGIHSCPEQTLHPISGGFQQKQINGNIYTLIFPSVPGSTFNNLARPCNHRGLSDSSVEEEFDESEKEGTPSQTESVMTPTDVSQKRETPAPLDVIPESPPPSLSHDSPDDIDLTAGQKVVLSSPKENGSSSVNDTEVHREALFFSARHMVYETSFPIGAMLEVRELDQCLFGFRYDYTDFLKQIDRDSVFRQLVPDHTEGIYTGKILNTLFNELQFLIADSENEKFKNPMQSLLRTLQFGVDFGFKDCVLCTTNL